MRKGFSLCLVGVVAMLGFVLSAQALTIIPNFVDGAGATWDATHRGVIQQAIDDWESKILDPQTVNMNFEFANAGTSYLGRWSGTFSAYEGTDLYPWSPEVTHKVSFNVATMYPLWWDDTPTTPDTPPSGKWDALSVARHELGHAMGFTDRFYYDDWAASGQVDKWAVHISGTTFDLGGLNVAMTSASDLAHTYDGGSTLWDLMTPSIYDGQRRDISDIDLDMLHLAYNYQMVPEPSSMVLLLVGLIGLGVYGRRQRA